MPAIFFKFSALSVTEPNRRWFTCSGGGALQPLALPLVRAKLDRSSRGRILGRFIDGAHRSDAAGPPFFGRKAEPSADGFRAHVPVTLNRLELLRAPLLRR